MKVVKIVEKSTETKRRYTRWQALIEEFYKSRQEIWTTYRPEDSWIDEKAFNNTVYLIKVIKAEYVDF